MAISLQRFARFLRSIFVPTTAIICFSCLLTFIFILYQPTPGPGNIQRLGWQSWDIISDTLTTVTDVDVGSPTGTEESGAISNPGSGNISHSVDWWNVTGPDTSAQFDPASLPLDVWDPLMPHDTGFSEIEVTSCWIDPWIAPFVTADYCAPSSTKEQDAIKGKWVPVGRNLNVQGIAYLNIFYRRTRRMDIPLVTDIRILPEGEALDMGDSDFSWTRVRKSISPQGPKVYLWYKLGKTLRDMTTEEKQQLITEIDIVYGDDEPWFGFEKLEPPAVAKIESKKVESVSLAIRKGVKPIPRAPPLHFSRDGKFKILQVADLHYSVSAGVCRDTVISPCTSSDNLTNSLVSHMLDVEKPDLVVFTGDQLNGQGTSWDAKSVLAKFSKTVTRRGIPWAAVFGNHDDEDGDTREEQVKYMQALPYSLVEPGPKDIHGVGNYRLKIWSADASKTQLLTLYFLDSGSYVKSWFDFTHLQDNGYDYIHQDQIDWFLEESSRISPIERPFTPDGAKDLGDIWKRQAADQLTPDTRRLAKPNALMFFHIPLEEAYSSADVDAKTGKPLDVGLHDLESHGNAKQQAGFFHKALLQAMESDHRAGGNAREVKVVANGHCHVTENCRRVQGVWMCFGGGGSYSGYGRIGFDRRSRVYDISDYGETIRTYKRTEHDEILDDMILVGKGALSPYEGMR